LPCLKTPILISRCNTKTSGIKIANRGTGLNVIFVG
jgi:hypothetical protein